MDEKSSHAEEKLIKESGTGSGVPLRVLRAHIPRELLASATVDGTGENGTAEEMCL